MPDKKQLKIIISYYRKLLMQYLELTNTNLTLVNQIKELFEILSNYRDLADEIPLNDPQLKEALNVTEKRLQAWWNRPALKLTEAKHFLDKHYQNLQLRQQRLETYAKLLEENFQFKLAEQQTQNQQAETQLTAQADIMQQTLTSSIPTLKLLQVLNTHAKILNENYLATRRELTELQLLLQHLQFGLGNFSHYVKQQFIHLQMVGQVIERELVQLVYHWRQLVDIAQDLELELAEQAQLEQQIKLKQQQSNTLYTTPISQPRLHPGSSEGKQDDKD